MKAKTGKLLLDSRYATVAGDEFTFSLNRQLKIYGLELLTANIPFSWYNVTATRANSIKWTSGGPHTAIIPDGFYDSYYMSQELEADMKAADGFVYSITVSDTTGLTTVSRVDLGIFSIDVEAGDIWTTYLGFDVQPWF